MLIHLSVQNYALISELEIDFGSGFSVITGETGAGKSILLGALSLLSGQRADASVAFDNTRKCVVEGCFDIQKYALKDFFDEQDLDYADKTLIRREISSDGRSRAFVNDTPVNLTVLKELRNRLIDIHSQHNNLYLEDPAFQLKVVDTFALHQPAVADCETKFREWRKAVSAEKELLEIYEKADAERDYKQFRWEELEKAGLDPQEQENLETEQKILENAEEIRAGLFRAIECLEGEEVSITGMTRETEQVLRKLSPVCPPLKTMAERLESVHIELRDLSREISALAETTETDPSRLEKVNARLDLMLSLQQKHRVQTVSELIAVREALRDQLAQITDMSLALSEAKTHREACLEALTEAAETLTKGRRAVISSIEKRVTSMLSRLGMPYGVFRVEFIQTKELTSNGKDKIRFLFSANANTEPGDLSKIASGGEMSRLMLSLKAAVAERVALPILVFDEIDSGVSGEMADKMASVMCEMSAYAQIISITHLPQVSARGNAHYLVFKTSAVDGAHTAIKALSPQERVMEIARMLSGSGITEAAIDNAKVLLKHSLPE
ncbi:MAG: DNA repair protein RecN [Bacteroidales bacterium]|nr:DNA repair protein RecN [Bacteroidales bacterium]